MAITNGQTNGASANQSEPLDWTTFSNTINGKLESTQKTRHGILPATGEDGPEVPLSTPDDVERAMTAAQAAFVTWSEVPYAERRAAVLAYADAIAVEKDVFSHMLTKEQGKPVSSYQLIQSHQTLPITEFLSAIHSSSLQSWSWT